MGERSVILKVVDLDSEEQGRPSQFHSGFR